MSTKRKKISIAIIFTIILAFSSLAFASIEGPTGVNVIRNDTKVAAGAAMVNTSGGYISTINMTATLQDPHWKAFIGWLDGRFTLSDSAGATIYDWHLTTINGQIYATRTSGTVTWTSAACASVSDAESENTALSLTNIDDNITATFKNATHKSFAIASKNITANSCLTLNTYVSNATQDSSFEEVVLKSGSAVIYATLIEHRIAGYNGSAYDFQMLVPENGSSTWTGSTAYYLYVELI